jgi:voltage-gated potassium channel
MQRATDQPRDDPQWKEILHEIIFEADTPAGKTFDVALLVAIALSVLVVSLDTVASVEARIGPVLRAAEWAFTGLFSIEYVLRLLAVRRPLAYARSFFGVVDLLAILPTYLSLLIPGTQSLLVIRGLRLLRILRVFKLARFLGEADVLMSALRQSGRKILLFVGAVVLIVSIVGALMYLIEGPEHGFTSIPRSMYWGVVTVTTVGYGDIAPQTVPGQMLAAGLMIIGYGIIAVPTGIFSAALIAASRSSVSTRACPSCGGEGHDDDATHCKFCGVAL